MNTFITSLLAAVVMCTPALAAKKQAQPKAPEPAASLTREEDRQRIVSALTMEKIQSDRQRIVSDTAALLTIYTTYCNVPNDKTKARLAYLVSQSDAVFFRSQVRSYESSLLTPRPSLIYIDACTMMYPEMLTRRDGYIKNIDAEIQKREAEKGDAK